MFSNTSAFVISIFDGRNPRVVKDAILASAQSNRVLNVASTVSCVGGVLVIYNDAVSRFSIDPECLFIPTSNESTNMPLIDNEVTSSKRW